MHYIYLNTRGCLLVGCDQMYVFYMCVCYCCLLWYDIVWYWIMSARCVYACSYDMSVVVLSRCRCLCLVIPLKRFIVLLSVSVLACVCVSVNVCDLSFMCFYVFGVVPFVQIRQKTRLPLLPLHARFVELRQRATWSCRIQPPT